jgi:DNA excision repair protein ERCC-2
MRPIWKSFPSVILTSGTISPLDLYPKILDFNPITLKSINIELGRNPISPIIVGTTPTQKTLSSEYVYRNDFEVSKAYGAMIIGLCSIVPDGMLCFFPSYMYMEHILNDWYKTGIISKLL